MSASAMEPPSDVGVVARPAPGWPCRRRTARLDAVRSPLVQYASPSRAAGAPRARWSSSSARSSARRACVIVPATSPRTRAVPARYIAIAVGSVRNASSSTTTISPAAPSVRRGSSHRSASRSRSSTPSSSPPSHERGRRSPMLSTGRTRNSSSGSASSQRRSVASCRSRRRSGIASSTRSAARSKSSPASAWPIASARSPLLLVPVARPAVQLADAGPAARPAGAPAGRRRTGGGSGTTGAGRRAGPGTGCPDRAPPAWPCRRPGR